MNIQLPKELETYREQIEKTTRPYIKLEAKIAQTKLFQSKFGGLPYLPKTCEHPKDEFGKPMKLMAQINFDELPDTESANGLHLLPKQGILQFFISAEDDMYGADLNNLTNQKNFKVMYHETIEYDESLLVSDFSYLDETNSTSFPIEEEMSLSFLLGYEAANLSDFKGRDLIKEELESILYDDDGYETELWEHYVQTVEGSGHKIGGYAYFTQSDPRERGYDEYDFLLLQIDTDENIMWGDSGIGNFFINYEDLLNKNFDNILYTWDCT